MPEIQLTQGQVTVVDDEDYDFLMQFKWCAMWNSQSCDYRPVRKTWEGGKRITILMYRVIAERAGFLAPMIDHIDHDPLNNQRENLRPATYCQNLQNARLRSDSTSGIKGVSWHKQKQKWYVRIYREKKSYSGGLFTHKGEARKAANALRRRLHGDFACDG